MKNKRWLQVGLVVVIGLLLVQFVGGWLGDEKSERLILATTTSTENSGLLAELIPPFEAESDYRVDVVAVGTGKALELGRSGDADILLVHAKDAEKEFIQQGYGEERAEIMYNDFVILGPETDPAGIKNSSDVLTAFESIKRQEELFISRGDESGTNKKELKLWMQAGISPAGSWYQETGQGMGKTLTIANEKQGYLLADRGTYLAYQDQLSLEILFSGDENLHNPYGVIPVSPDEHEDVNYTGAQELLEYLTSSQARGIIANYKVEGEQLFTPVD
jgi:tungstate transport system substrate-binding protein